MSIYKRNKQRTFFAINLAVAEALLENSIYNIIK
jgi:hypothetical protein